MAVQLSDKLDSSQPYRYLMFENKSNNCWLNSSLALIAHSKVLEKMINSDRVECKIKEVISMYHEAISTLNEPNISIDSRVKTVRDKLHKIQSNVHHYLQPILKYEVGEPDSAFCALLNLINENKTIKEQLSISWLWKKLCSKCGNKSSENVKPIITLSKVNNFAPECPTSIYVCSCKEEKEMKLFYKELPPCLFFHFEKGAGNQILPPVIFSIQDRKYQLTGVITLEKSKDSSINHFITWIRNPTGNTWLECNDLNLDIISFSPEQPAFNLKEVYMYVFESFDNLGKIHNDISAEEIAQQDSGTDVEVIDLSDESEGINSPLKKKPEINVSTSDVNVKNIEKCEASLFLRDSLADSNQDSKKKQSVSSKLDKLTSTNMQSLKTEKKDLGSSDSSTCVKSEGTSNVPDMRNVFIKNLRFSKPIMLQNLELDRLKLLRPDDPQQPSVNKDKIKEDRNGFQIETGASLSNSSESKSKNTENHEEGDSLVTKMDIIRSDIQKNVDDEKNMIVDVDECVKSLAVDVSKSSHKSDLKPETSNTSDKLTDNERHCLEQFKKKEENEMTIVDSILTAKCDESSVLSKSQISCSSNEMDQIQRHPQEQLEGTNKNRNSTIEAASGIESDYSDFKSEIFDADNNLISHTFKTKCNINAYVPISSDKSEFETVSSDTSNGLDDDQNSPWHLKGNRKVSVSTFKLNEDESPGNKKKYLSQNLIESSEKISASFVKNVQNLVIPPYKIPGIVIEEDESPWKKRKSPSQNLIESSEKDSASLVKSMRNLVIPPYKIPRIMTESNSEEDKKISDSECRSQLRMQEVAIKKKKRDWKVEKVKISANAAKVLNTNKKSRRSVKVRVCKTNKESPKYKVKEIQANARTENHDKLITSSEKENPADSSTLDNENNVVEHSVIEKSVVKHKANKKKVVKCSAKGKSVVKRKTNEEKMVVFPLNTNNEHPVLYDDESDEDSEVAFSSDIEFSENMLHIEVEKVAAAFVEHVITMDLKT